MHLVFPGGEHPHVRLSPGIHAIGSGASGAVVLSQPGVHPRHCEVHAGDAGLRLHASGKAQTLVNGRPVSGVIALRVNDVIGVEGVQARVVSAEPVASPASMPAADMQEDHGATLVRPVVPRHVLRGVSGAVFGKTYPVVGITVAGRGQDCNLHLEAPGLSRQHARLTPMEKGLWVEDLGSTNGCYINGRRIRGALAAHGDELSLDTVRFRVVAPGGEAGVAGAQAGQRHRRQSGASWVTWSGWLVAGLALGAAVVVYLVLS